jgi:hypothetical protein
MAQPKIIRTLKSEKLKQSSCEGRGDKNFGFSLFD